ncbi:hypothetical protein EVAR_84331_1 [Eumeta japonica]|uniref:Uncharacterized protein n=1 Tax=Eumeta variegata TaxID=151549 RepID=A0A4C1U4M4_EUMVA|nr:hypothetical protein EVAR_84331_1 [Eumeta japonica]
MRHDSATHGRACISLRGSQFVRAAGARPRISLKAIKTNVNCCVIICPGRKARGAPSRPLILYYEILRNERPCDRGDVSFLLHEKNGYKVLGGEFLLHTKCSV